MKSDGMRRPVSDGMRYAPKLSTRFEAQEIKERIGLKANCRNIAISLIDTKKGEQTAQSCANA
jgi:hypothetical protein